MNLIESDFIVEDEDLLFLKKLMYLFLDIRENESMLTDEAFTNM